jgi:hypothetical protein
MQTPQIKTVEMLMVIIQFNSIYLCAKLNSPEANYKVSTGKKIGRVRSKKVSENNIIVTKVIKYDDDINNNNSIQFFIIYVPSQQLQGQLQT